MIENNSNYLVSSVPVNLTFNASQDSTSNAIKFDAWSCPACIGICFCFGCKPVKETKHKVLSIAKKDFDSESSLESTKFADIVRPSSSIAVSIQKKCNNLPSFKHSQDHTPAQFPIVPSYRINNSNNSNSFTLVVFLLIIILLY